MALLEATALLEITVPLVAKVLLAATILAAVALPIATVHLVVKVLVVMTPVAKVLQAMILAAKVLLAAMTLAATVLLATAVHHPVTMDHPEVMGPHIITATGHLEARDTEVVAKDRRRTIRTTTTRRHITLIQRPQLNIRQFSQLLQLR